MSWTCRYCYSSVKDEHKFCTQCGKEVSIPEYKETKNENVKNNNHSFNEIKYYDGMGWGKASIISFMIFLFFFFVLYFPSNSVNTNTTKKEIPKIETNEPIKELSLDEKSIILKEAKKDFDTKNYNSSITKLNKLFGLNYKPAEVKFYLGQNWYMKKAYSMAIFYYEESAKLDDKATYIQILLHNKELSLKKIKDKENQNKSSKIETTQEIKPSLYSENKSKVEETKSNFDSNDYNLKKYDKNISSAKYDNDVTKNTYSIPEQALPYNGEIRNYSYLEKVAPLNIKTSYGANYLVKLKGAYNKEPIMTVFIVGGNEITINVPLGSFEITYASGNKWYGYDYLFGKETSYSKADEIFNFRDTGYEISGYTITLYRVSNGNLNTQNINQSQF